MVGRAYEWGENGSTRGRVQLQNPEQEVMAAWFRMEAVETEK